MQDSKGTFKKRIGIANGPFNAADALACHLLTHLDEWKDAEIGVHSLYDSKEDVLVGVGGTTNAELGRFDYTQRGFQETLSPSHSIPLSSAGLIYKHFGKKIVQKITGCSERDLVNVYNRVYKFVEAIDAQAHRISRYPEHLAPAWIDNTGLFDRVDSLNPAWNERGANLMERFREAMQMTGKEFTEHVLFISQSWLPARSIVEEALNSRFQTDLSGEIVVLKKPTIWTRHLFELEVELKIGPQIKFVLYTAESWRIQQVPVREGSFDARVALPAPWRGLRDQKLRDVVGLETCRFVHANGFMGGADTFDDVLEMARRSIAFSHNQSGSAPN
jgi:uncharacterized UPF0160 family protein